MSTKINSGSVLLVIPDPSGDGTFTGRSFYDRAGLKSFLDKHRSNEFADAPQLIGARVVEVKNLRTLVRRISFDLESTPMPVYPEREQC